MTTFPSYRKSAIKPSGGRIYFKHIFFLGGGGGVEFNWGKMMVSVLPQELYCKVDKLKYKKLEVVLTVGEYTIPDQSFTVLIV